MSSPTLHIPSQTDSMFYTILVKETSPRKEAKPPIFANHVYPETCVANNMNSDNKRRTTYTSKNPLILFQNKQV